MPTFSPPRFSRAQIDLAEKILVKYDDIQYLLNPEYNEALDIVNNWRSAHSYPLNTIQMDLRRKVKSVQSDVLVAQRTKRLPSIVVKLSRFKSLRLSQMQDIGGCRAIVDSSDRVYDLVERYRKSRFEHKLHNERDYIQKSDTDGYRGYHLIYKYRGRKEKSVYNNLRIEIQLRSSLQHVWATAVETVDHFTGQSLKLKQGQSEWRRFFTLMSGVIAKIEGTPPVPGCPSSYRILRKEIAYLTRKLNVIKILSGLKASLEYIDRESKADTKYFVINLNLEKRVARISQFSSNQVRIAHEKYLALEKFYANSTASEIYMVSVSQASSILRAYPNLFLDTEKFLDLLDQTLNTN